MQRYQGEAALPLNSNVIPCCQGTCPRREKEYLKHSRWELPKMPNPEQYSNICEDVIFLKTVDKALQKAKCVIKYAEFIEKGFDEDKTMSIVNLLKAREKKKNCVGDIYCPVTLKYMLKKAKMAKDIAYKLCMDLSISPFSRTRSAAEDAKKEISSTYLRAKIGTSLALQIMEIIDLATTRADKSINSSLESDGNSYKQN